MWAISMQILELKSPSLKKKPQLLLLCRFQSFWCAIFPLIFRVQDLRHFSKTSKSHIIFENNANHNLILKLKES